MTSLATDSGRKTPVRLAGRAVLACQSDDRLVQLARAGHERAFEAIVERYRKPLLRFCGGILPQSRSEDAVQQTFINAHAALLESAEPVQLKPWLFTIARNASLNMLRQNGWNYDQIPLDFDGVRRPDQVYEQRAALEQTVSAINELPDRQRDALVMREFEGRSYDEIGAALSANDGAVRQLLNRARIAMRAAATAIIPPPLVARIATATPGDGSRAAEVAGGLGAAGVAKVSATALVAGTLVVGAVKAPLPVDGASKERREKATAAQDAPVRAKADSPVAVVRAAPARASTPAPRSKQPAKPNARQRRGSATPVVDDNSGSGRSRSEARERSGRETEREREESSNSGPGGGSDDDAVGAEVQEEPSSSGPGSDDAVTSYDGSDDVAPVLGTETDSSSSGTSGSGSDDTSPSGSGTSGSVSGDALETH